MRDALDTGLVALPVRERFQPLVTETTPSDEVRMGSVRMSGMTGNFGGAAGFYAKSRPGYPAELFDLLVGETPLDASSVVLDLGCGTGLASLPLAARVRLVVGVDPDPGMLAEAASSAQGLPNVRWVCSPAEEYDEQPGRFDLIIIGSAFHWMNRPLVANRSYRLLRPGGLLAIASNPTPLLQIRDQEGVGAAIAAVQDRWFPDARRLKPGAPRLASNEQILGDSPFRHTVVHEVPTRQEWNIERLLDFLRSTSWRSDQALGPRFDEFAGEVEQAVRSVEPSGQWSLEAPARIVMARRA